MATTAHVHTHAAPEGFIRKYIFSLDHKVIGLQYYFLALTAVFIGMLLSVLMRFHMIWPDRQETVSGGTISSGDNPDEPPVADGVTTVGADSDEGVPYHTPDLEPREHGIPRHCFTS